MSLHGESPPKTAQDIQELVDFLRVEVSGINNPPGCNMLKNFGRKNKECAFCINHRPPSPPIICNMCCILKIYVIVS
jgi:hypothetical protein